MVPSRTTKEPTMSPLNAIQDTTTATFKARGIPATDIRVFSRDGKRWLIAGDVCKVLELRTDTLPRIVPPEGRCSARVMTNGGVQSVTAITEEALAVLVMRSSLPHAKALRDWVVAEVVPKVAVVDDRVGEGADKRVALRKAKTIDQVPQEDQTNDLAHGIDLDTLERVTTSLERLAHAELMVAQAEQIRHAGATSRRGPGGVITQARRALKGMITLSSSTQAK
jgi:prophage antirepressor-like protein